MNGFHLPYDHLPLFLPYPESLLTMDMSITECRVYMLLLRRSHLSARSERWVDGDGRVFLYYPIRDLARALRRSETSVKKALNALEEKDLILRVRQGAGKPNRIYVKIPMEEGPWDPETDAMGASGTDTLPSPGGDTPGVPGMGGKVAPSKIDREERNAEERGKDRPAPDPAPGESPFLPGEAGEGEAYDPLTGIRQPLGSELRLTDPGKGGDGLPPCASRPRRARAGASYEFSASQSSRPQARRIPDHFGAEFTSAPKYLSRSGLRRRKLHIIRFGPEGQSSFIPQLLLSKWKRSFHFEKDVSPESAGICACADTRHSGE